MGYVLINPRIQGREISSKRSSNSDAANEIWSELSGNIKNFVPKFYFTLQNTKTNGLSHYVVKESFKNDKVKYKLKQYKSKKMNDKEILNMFSQDGGRRRDRDRDEDDDSSSDSSSSETVFTLPTGKSWKDYTLLYYPTVYGVPLVSYPTFKFPFVTGTSLVLSSYPFTITY
jgi:hypothetical protein